MKKLGLLLFAFILFSCSAENLPAENSYTLTLKNSYDELVFTQVSLPDYNFTPNSSDVQTFNLNNGMSFVNNVRITLNYECMSRTGSKDVLVNFYYGQITTIELTKLFKSTGGCSLTFVVSYE